jgi:hypothetical protein
VETVRAREQSFRLPYQRLLLGTVVLGLGILASFAIASPAAAVRDLTVTVTAESAPADNQSVFYNLTASNTGDSAAGPVTIQLYVDGNATGPLHDLGNVASGTNESVLQNLTLVCGVYTINATIDPGDQVPETNETNNNASIIVMVNPAFSLAPTILGSPGNITLVLDASGSHGCEPLNVTWDIGGVTRYGALVNYTPAAGPLSVTLTVRSATYPSLFSSHTVGLTIPNAPPSLTVGIANATVRTLTPLALAIEADDMDGFVASYLIDFGDGNNTANIANASTYAYHRSGTFTITVTVTDNLGATNVSTLLVHVTNRAPSLSTGFPYWITNVGDVVRFNASGSSDPEGGGVTIAWDFGDGTTATGAAPTHTFSSPGVYHVNVTVTDAEGASTTGTIDVTVLMASSDGGSLVIWGVIILVPLLLLLLLLLALRRRRKDDEEPKPPVEGQDISGKPPSP